jgi:hypothetical protein
MAVVGLVQDRGIPSEEKMCINISTKEISLDEDFKIEEKLLYVSGIQNVTYNTFSSEYDRAVKEDTCRHI